MSSTQLPFSSADGFATTANVVSSNYLFGNGVNILSSLTSGNGATGATGATGPTGATGATGAQGNLGATGLTGATGPTGATGANGVDGATGPQGNDGATGTRGSEWFAGTDDPLSTIPGIQDQDFYFKTTDNSIWQYSAGIATWYRLSNITGATGTAGMDGATGPQGDVGATGVNGTDGATGATGPQGETGATGAQGATGVADLGNFTVYQSSLYTADNSDAYFATFWDSGPGYSSIKLPGDANAPTNPVTITNSKEGGAGVKIITSNPNNGNTEYDWTFGSDGTVTLPLTIDSSTTKQIKYGLGNLAVQLDGGWCIGEYNGTAWGTEGVRIDPAIEGYTGVSLPGSLNANVQSTSLYNTAGGNVQITSGAIGGPSFNWSFDSTGAVTLPSSFGPFGSAGTIQTLNAYPTLLAYGSGGGGGIHGGPELDWADTSVISDIFGNVSVHRNVMFINGEGLFVGMNQNYVAGNISPSWLFAPDGSLTLPAGNATTIQSGQIFASNGSGFINLDVQFNNDVLGGVRLGTDTSTPVDIVTNFGLGGSPNVWRFGSNGAIALPNDAGQITTTDNNITITATHQRGRIDLIGATHAGYDGGRVGITGGNGADSGSNSRFGGRVEISGGQGVNGAVGGSILLSTYDETNNSSNWTFDVYGNIELPHNGVISNPAGGFVGGAAIQLSDLAYATPGGPAATINSNGFTNDGWQYILFDNEALYNAVTAVIGTSNGYFPITWSAGSTLASGYVIVQFQGGFQFQMCPVVDAGAGQNTPVSGTWVFPASLGGTAVTAGVGITTDTAVTWKFDTAGNLTLPSDSSHINYANGTSILNGITSSGGGSIGSFGTDKGIGADYASNNPAVLFSEDDMLIRTGGTASTGGSNYGEIYIAASEDAYFGQADSLVDSTYPSFNTSVYADSTQITINTPNSNTWTFDNTGNLTLPGGTQISATNGNLLINSIRSSTTNSYSEDTTNVLYYNPTTHEVTRAPVNNITGDPFAAATTGTSDVTVWTASSADVVGAKLMVRVVYSNGSWVNTEMLEVMIAKNYPDGNPSFTVTNRVKTNNDYSNVLINVTLDGSNRLQLISSAPSGDGHNIYWTYTATSFNQTFD